MNLRNKPALLAAAGLVALVIGIPAISQDKPESILPPGFGDPVEETTKPSEPVTRKPADLVPDIGLKTPDEPSGPAMPSSSSSNGSTSASSATATGTTEDGEDDETMTAAPVLQDLPAQARRSTARVGVLEVDSGDMGAEAFGSADGKYLSHLMRKTKAPIASRWVSIVLRRALLSQVNTPSNLAGADWVAERAWLLLRMGEADAARMLVQAVDADRYTPKLMDVALQVALANADPSAACAFTENLGKARLEQSWTMVRAICSSLSGESAQAGALIDQARDQGAGKGIDGTLAEKVVGAGINTRRAVQVQWDGVSQLTAWRFGMATATAADIPEKLYATVGPHVRAWQARAPMLSPEKRLAAADIATALGVFSSAALVDFYGYVGDVTDPAESAGKPYLLLRNAYAGNTAAGRITAMKSLWDSTGEDARGRYARLILTARAAARISPSKDHESSLDLLLASMLSAGLDVQASQWAQIANEGGIKSWGLLAVGAPSQVVPWTRSKVESYINDAGDETNRGAYLFAGIAGLGRLPGEEVSDMASDMAIPIGRQTAWTRALDRAVAAREPATVALLCGLGLAGTGMEKVTPTTLYHAVSALRRVGLGAEARMLAAEALTRS